MSGHSATRSGEYEGFEGEIVPLSAAAPGGSSNRLKQRPAFSVAGAEET